MNDAAQAWDTFKRLMREDPDYAWSWHCNIAVPIMDAINVSHEDANLVAAHLLSFLFDCDSTQHPNYEYGKTDAQRYHEMRVEADRLEDAASVRPA